MPQWDLAAVVVAIIAIPLAMSPAASSFLWVPYLALSRSFFAGVCSM